MNQTANHRHHPHQKMFVESVPTPCPPSSTANTLDDHLVVLQSCDNCQCCPYGFHIDTDFVRYCDQLLSTLYNVNNNNQSFDHNHHHHKSNYKTRTTITTNEDSEDSKNPILLPEIMNEMIINDDDDNQKTSLSSSSSSSNPNQEDNNSSVSPTASSSCLSTSISKSVLTQIRNHLALSLLRVKELEDQVSQIGLLKEEILKLEKEKSILLEKLNSSQIVNDNQATKKDQNTLSLITFDPLNIIPEERKKPLTTTRNVGTLTNFAPCKLYRNVFVQTDLKAKNILLASTSLSREVDTNDAQDDDHSDKNKMKKCYHDEGSQTDDDYYSQLDNLNYHKRCSSSNGGGGVENGGKVGRLNGEIIDNCCNNSSDDDGQDNDNPQEKNPQQEHEHRSNVVLSTNNDNGLNNNKLANNNQSTSCTPTSSIQSMNLTSVASAATVATSEILRLCEKCNNVLMINDSEEQFRNSPLSSPDTNTNNTISMPCCKIIKSDSGISVEHQRQIDKIQREQENDEEEEQSRNTNNDSNIIDQDEIQISKSSLDYFHQIPVPISSSDENSSIEETVSANSSTGADNPSQIILINQQKDLPNNKIKTFTPSSEIKTALKIINDNLYSHNKSFLFSKSVAVVKKNWFKISSSVDSDYNIVESYLDFIEKYFKSTKLLDFIVNLNDTNGNTAIHYAISYNNFDIVSILLDSKICDVNKYNKAGYTATMLVSLAKIENEIYRDIVERLFNQADVNLKAKQNGQTALMLAASHGRLEISKILLECGAEVNLQDNDGSTALMCAAEHGHTEVISLLLSQPDCDPLIEDNEGSTALKIALINGHNDIGILLYAGQRTSSIGVGNFFTNNNRTSTPNSQSNRSKNHKRTGSFNYSGTTGSSTMGPSMGFTRKSPPKFYRRSSFSSSSSSSS